jgi:hypothetical protein
MGAVIVIGTAVVGILLASTAGQLASEFRDWTPYLTEWLINRAVRRLPTDDLRARMSEEWHEFVSDTPGHIGKVLRAAGLGVAAKRVALELSDVSLSEHMCSRALAMAALIFVGPLMMFLAIMLIWRGGGPVLEKSGKLYRFRVSDDDPLGRLMVRSNFDELPSLWNFARGDTTFRLKDVIPTLVRLLSRKPPNQPQ